jgi:hypothetical protein
MNTLINWNMVSSESMVASLVRPEPTKGAKVKFTFKPIIKVENVVEAISRYVSMIDIAGLNMSIRDKRKVGEKLRKAMEADKRKQYGNTSRISQVLSLIEKVQKLNAKALDDSDLKQAILDRLWIIYTDIEANGLDDSHWQQTDIPCNEYKTGWLYYQPSKKVIGRERLSSYSTSDQKLILNLVRKFQ